MNVLCIWKFTCLVDDTKLRCVYVLYVLISVLKTNKKASIRWQDSARRQFQAGLIGDVGL